MALPTSGPTITDSTNQADKFTSILASICPPVSPYRWRLHYLRSGCGPLDKEIVRANTEGSNVLGVLFQKYFRTRHPQQWWVHRTAFASSRLSFLDKLETKFSLCRSSLSL